MSEEVKEVEEKEEFYLFWGGLFSQWAMIPMEIDGVEYNCCEQYMMAEKAKLFEDEEMLKKIMASKDPRQQKMEYGRNVKDFDQGKWEAVAKDIVYKANYEKFTQNSDCFLEMSRSRGYTVVEASPYDVIWGIGLGVDDPKAKIRSEWRGTNWLGEIIEKVRDELEELRLFEVLDYATDELEKDFDNKSQEI